MTIIKFNCFSIVFIASMCLSCNKDWLEKKAEKTQVIPSSLKDYQALLENYLSVNAVRISLGEVASDGHYTNDQGWVSVPDKVRNAYTWTYTRPYSNQTGSYEWNDIYARVFNMNIILDGLKRLKPSNEIDLDIWKNIKGQALYHRAESFFFAAQVWAPPYRPETAISDLSIALRLEADVSLPSTRSSVDDTYNRIIDDLLEATKLLPLKPLYKTRPSKSAAFALLSRTYLSMANYDRSGAFADSCLNIYDSLLDYSLPAAGPNFIGDFRTNPEILLHIIMPTAGLNNVLSSSCFIEQGLYNLYDTNDLRRTKYFKVNANGSISYIGNYNNSTTNLFCGPATDEMYLTRAECNARKGKLAEAMKDLNKLLRARWKKVGGNSIYIDQIASSVNDALVAILTERKKELILRGLRWMDLRRLNQEPQFKITVSRLVGGNTYILEPNSYKYTFPIPDDIIQWNPDWRQNPGW